MDSNQEKKLKHEMKKQCSDLEENLKNKKKWTKNEYCIHSKERKNKE